MCMKRIRQAMSLIMAVCLSLIICGCGVRHTDQKLSRMEIREQIHSLEIEIGAADIRIEQGEQFAMETDNPYISAEVKDGTLVIRERKHAADLEESNLTIWCPGDTVFRVADVDVAAGILAVGRLSCERLDLDLGAGMTEIAVLTVTGKAEISGGVGEIQILNGSIRDLDLELGIGTCVIRSRLTGYAEVDAGVGGLELTVLGAREDYTIRVEQGLGLITVDGETWSGEIAGSGENRIELSGGVGTVRLHFGTDG